MSQSGLTSPLVSVLAYDGLCTFEFGICAEVFGLPRPEIPGNWYDYRIVGESKAPMSAGGGLKFSTEHDLGSLRDADLILIPGWRGLHVPIPADLISRIRDCVDRGGRVASICSGVFVLAAAGLLDGRKATTHWRYTDQLKQMYPLIDVEPDVLYVDEGAVLTSAGSAAGLDLCLHIVRSDHGVEIANMVAKRLVLPAHREGGQAQFIPRPMGSDRGGGISPLLDTVRSKLNETWSVGRMASRAGLTPRTLLRRFRDVTGCSPMEWLTRERVAYCCELLETSSLPVGPIAERSGFNSPETLRHHFRKLMGISPQAYRRSFAH